VDTSSFCPKPEDLKQSLRGATAGDVVLLVQQSLRFGNGALAVALCDAARALGVDDPALDVSEAAARFAGGDIRGGAEVLDELLGASPGHLVALYQKAHLLVRQGNATEARQILSTIVERFPDFPGAHGALASLLFPGAPYRDVLARIHAVLRPETYLEIGVEHGVTLALATTARVAAGVDPADLPLENPLPAGARLFHTTSDDFFSNETRASVFGTRAVDLAFIDGMHWFEYAVRDFAHAEQWATEDSVILVHDCLAVTRVAAARDRVSTFWVGDVWKALECLLDYRPDLVVHIVPTAPSGLVVVRGLDPKSRVLFDRADEITAKYRDAEYPYDPGAWPERLGLVENDEGGLARALGV